jgi:hypothetical protein
MTTASTTKATITANPILDGVFIFIPFAGQRWR